jgi:hypothetical protein
MTNAIKEHTGSFPETVLRNFPSIPMSHFENTLCRDRIPNGPFRERTLHQCNMPAWTPPHGFFYHIIGTINSALRFLPSRSEHTYDLEILFEKVFYFDINIGNTVCIKSGKNRKLGK